jgi:hypothetical protein
MTGENPHDDAAYPEAGPTLPSGMDPPPIRYGPTSHQGKIWAGDSENRVKYLPFTQIM